LTLAVPLGEPGAQRDGVGQFERGPIEGGAVGPVGAEQRRYGLQRPLVLPAVGRAQAGQVGGDRVRSGAARVGTGVSSSAGMGASGAASAGVPAACARAHSEWDGWWRW
jgi:hypothetical protein